MTSDSRVVQEKIFQKLADVADAVVDGVYGLYRDVRAKYFDDDLYAGGPPRKSSKSQQDGQAIIGESAFLQSLLAVKKRAGLSKPEMFKYTTTGQGGVIGVVLELPTNVEGKPLCIAMVHYEQYDTTYAVMGNKEAADFIKKGFLPVRRLEEFDFTFPMNLGERKDTLTFHPSVFIEGSSAADCMAQLQRILFKELWTTYTSRVSLRAPGIKDDQKKTMASEFCKTAMTELGIRELVKAFS